MKLFWKNRKERRTVGYRRLTRSYWKLLFRTRSEDHYREKRDRLDAAGIDYRVWMYADEPNLIYLREYLGQDNEALRRHYIFLVRRPDLKEAYRVLGLLPCRDNGVDAIGL